MNSIASSELSTWIDDLPGGNLITALIRKSVADITQDCGPSIKWLGATYFDWYDIALITRFQYFKAREALIKCNGLRFVKTHVPGIRLQMIFHSLDLDAPYPDPPTNAVVWRRIKSRYGR